VIARSERKSGGWVTIVRALGPLRHERTVAWRDRSYQHAWRIVLGRLVLGRGHPGGRLQLNYPGRRVRWEIWL
jgi:hypothetical protein